MSKFIVYGDESGIEGTAEYCILAGYVGTPEVWRDFEREWIVVLQQFGVSEFHAGHFFQPQQRSRSRDYAGWSDGRCLEFLHALVDILNTSEVIPIGAALHVPEFKTLGLFARRFLTGGIVKKQTKIYPDLSGHIRLSFASSGAPNRPYMAVIQRFAVNALLSTPDGAKVDFVMDRNSALAPRAIETFGEQFCDGRTQRLDLEVKVGTIVFEDSRDYAGIQVADLCAYVWNRLLGERCSWTITDSCSGCSGSEAIVVERL